MSFENNEEIKEFKYDAIQICLASPDTIRSWSKGEVTKSETINYRTLKPEVDGLFCEVIFGPTKDWECSCGKYKKTRDKGIVCDRCGVEVTKSSVRRERMGHIELAAPVSHLWYFKGIPSRMALILDLSPKALDRVLYFSSYVVLDPGETNLSYKQFLNLSEYQSACEKYGENSFRVGMGAEAVQELLRNVNLEEEAIELRQSLHDISKEGQKRAKAIKRLEVIESFRDSGNKPEWMILNVIPVLPPDLRPMVQLDGGRFATSDMNDLYRRIINRNNRLKELYSKGVPDVIIRNEKRILQEAVDSLIDNGKRGKAITGPGNRNLKSLSDMLKGKQGRFRQNLLGKRVDYSGRSVIVVGPELKIYQCGLPKEMAIELFKPFVMRELTERGIAHNVKTAKKMVERLETEVWDVLEDVIKEHPVMLNRAPTLHRLGIQAFEPILVEGKAIKLHPLVCTAFNADFDGDQMAVHLPLTVEAQAECRFLLLSPNNLLKPSDGGLVAVPSQDMVLGIYYLTIMKDNDKGEGKYFKNVNEAIIAYENGEISLHAKINVKQSVVFENKEYTGVVTSTLGRFIFNEIISQDLGFVDRNNPDNMFKIEVDFLVGKKQLKNILERYINLHGATSAAELLDKIKQLGYKYSTKAAMTVSVSDMTVPEEKKTILKNAEETVEKITRNFRRGLITDEERYKEVVEIWKNADDKITDALLSGLDKYNNIYMMADSGARGSDQQIKQLAGMRGLMADTTGKTIELPIKSNFREGLDVLEYFISAHGARKGLSDTALRTADSGYLTRRLVDVAQDQIIRNMDCCQDEEEILGMYVSAFTDGKEIIESLEERIVGRYSCETIYDDFGNVLVEKNGFIKPQIAKKIVETKKVLDAGQNAKIKIRTNLTCKSRIGVCAKCYGANMATGTPVQLGEAVGIIAAQSIGEPGTQLTMRTFHNGGIAGGDITQGLPRVEELFEARKPKGLAIVSEIPGVISINDSKKKREVVVRNDETGEVREYFIPYGSIIKVSNGEVIEKGDPLTEGSINPDDILEIKGKRAVQDYIIKEVQRVYRLQGVELNDKHIEIIVRQMLKKVKVTDITEESILPDSLVDRFDVEDINERRAKENKAPLEYKDKLLGITKASLSTDSFLSGASFQETAKVLTDAATKGKIDKLLGIKENVIIGKLIPAGTGMSEYRNVKLDNEEEYDATVKELREKAEIRKIEQEREEEQKQLAEGRQNKAKLQNLAEDSEEDYYDEEEFEEDFSNEQ